MCEWCYSYRSRENKPLEGRVCARSRDDAFVILKSRGINPFRVELAPGFLNRLRSLGRRWLAIALLSGVAVAFAVLSYSLHRETQTITQSARNRAEALPRQRISGMPPDLAIRLPAIFPFESERFMALCAEPGIIPIDCGLPAPGLRDLTEALSHDITVSDGDEEWVATLKRVVIGMKDDAALLAKKGKSPEDIRIWLSERQKMELTYRNQIIMGAGTMDEKAKKLRAMGL